MNPFKVKGDKRFLVIARVGDSSLHSEWLRPPEHKNFDLCLSYFDSQPGRFSEDCDFYHQAPGVKWPKLKEIISLFGNQINHYDAIWLPDDDISTNAYDINRMFELFMQYELELAQPALTSDSYYSHKITCVNKEYRLRYTQFVEPMIPIYSRAAFQTLLPTFEKSEAAYGLDFVWPKVLGYPHKKIGIIDDVPMKHTRPVGGGTLYQNITNNRWDDFHRVTKEYAVEVNWHPSHYDGVPQGKKMMFAVLAQHDEKVLEAQLDNIRHYNPEAGIVVYNVSKDQELPAQLNALICPYSRPVRSDNLAPFMWDVMKWLHENKLEYEYFIALNSEMLFVKQGFDSFLDKTMKYSDCMGWDMQRVSNQEEADSDSKESMWKETRKWTSLLGNDGFFRYYFPGQVYRREIVKRMLSAVTRAGAEHKLVESEVSSLEEFFFVTLAASLKGRCREYPRDRLLNVISPTDDVDMSKMQQAIHHAYYYFIHPVRGEQLMEMNRWLMGGDTAQEDDPVQYEHKTDNENQQDSIGIRKRRWKRKRKVVLGRKKMWNKRKIVRGKRAVPRKAIKKTLSKKAIPRRKRMFKRPFKGRAVQRKRIPRNKVNNSERTVWKNIRRSAPLGKLIKAA